jgi:mannitol/fructose-specific phosphotransferase system IIA component (Ntr-type)
MLAPIVESHGYLPSDHLLSSIAMHLETALQRLGSSSVRRKVWVICGSGVATARNLISRLNLHLPQVGILGLASAFELARDPGLVRGADAIISTIPLEWMTDIEVLQVSPLLTKDEVSRLSSALQLDAPKAPMPHLPSPTSELSLVKLLCPRTIETGAVAQDWEEVVDCAGALLLDVGAVWPSYIEAMKDMIRLYGPYVVVAPGAALLHAGPEMGGKRLCMSLVTLRNPVPFGHSANDPVQVALAFSSIDHSTHVGAIGQAMTLFSNVETLRALGGAESAAHVLQIIRNALAAGPPALR